MLVYIGGLEIMHLLSVLVRVHPGLCATNRLEQVRRHLVRMLAAFPGILSSAVENLGETECASLTRCSNIPLIISQAAI